MKKLLILSLVIVALFVVAGVASAEHGNIGGVGTSRTHSGQVVR
jgi:hypothetical protein